MLLATLICSDEDCAAEIDLAVRDLDGLEATACDCGCTLVLLDVSEWTPPRVRVRQLALAA